MNNKVKLYDLVNIINLNHHRVNNGFKPKEFDAEKYLRECQLNDIFAELDGEKKKEGQLMN